MNATSLGATLREKRKELGLTQADLALATGTGIRFISDLENGKETCQIGKVIQVAECLGFELQLAMRGAR